MTNIIKIKRGPSSNIPNVTLEQGELAITTDTNELYVGTSNGKEKLNNSDIIDTLPMDGLIQYNGTVVPEGYEKVSDENFLLSESVPTIYYGTENPSNTLGKNGDLYIKIKSE